MTSPARLLPAAITALLGATELVARNDALVVAEPLTGIEVDGDLSDWPDAVDWHPISRHDYRARTSV